MLTIQGRLRLEGDEKLTASEHTCQSFEISAPAVGDSGHLLPEGRTDAVSQEHCTVLCHQQKTPVSMPNGLPAICVWTTIGHADNTSSAVFQGIAYLIPKLAIVGLEDAFPAAT